MGTRFEISAWLPGQPGGVGPEKYGNVQIWSGNSRFRLLGAFVTARLARKVPLTVVYR